MFIFITFRSCAKGKAVLIAIPV